MRNWLSTAAGVATLALLVGCSSSSTSVDGNGPPGGVRQFVTLGENWAFAFQAEPIMREMYAAKPAGGDAFLQGLYDGYTEHAEYEYGPLNMDFRDAIYHARKAIAAAHGTAPQPTAMSERVIPADKVDELTQARARLVAALAAPTPMAKSTEAGKAQAFFDCWMEQQEENFQPLDIAYCRNGFYANLEAIEAKPAQTPEVISLSTDILFDFDKSTLRPDGRAELDKLAQLLVSDTTTQLLVWGYADTAGPKPYNQRLSERRAEAVARYLESKGVSRSRMEIRGFGETNLAVQTPDNTPEQRNRRVEIRRR